MIVVDTSVWIAAQRRPYVDEVLQELIDADEVAMALPVRLELWAGVARQDRKAHRAAFGALPQLGADRRDVATAHRVDREGRDAGERFTVTDLLIASLTSDIGGLVWSLDKDFERMEKLGFVSLYQPPDVH